MLGNLNNGTNAGLSYVNGNNTLGNGNWNILARNSRLKYELIFDIAPKQGINESLSLALLKNMRLEHQSQKSLLASSEYYTNWYNMGLVEETESP